MYSKMFSEKKKSIKSDLECSKYTYIKQNLVYIPVKQSR